MREELLKLANEINGIAKRCHYQVACELSAIQGRLNAIADGRGEGVQATDGLGGEYSIEYTGPHTIQLTPMAPEPPTAAAESQFGPVTEAELDAARVDLRRQPVTTDAGREDALPDEGAYLVKFDDAEREDVLFSGAGAKDCALKYYEQVSFSWNAHLFAKIDSNSRDCTVPNATITPAGGEDGRDAKAACYDWLCENAECEPIFGDRAEFTIPVPDYVAGFDSFEEAVALGMSAERGAGSS